MTVFFALLRTAVKVGPLAILYFLLLLSLFETHIEIEIVLLVLLLGAIICIVIAFFAGLLVFGTIALIHESRPIRGTPLHVFEKILPWFIFVGFAGLCLCLLVEGIDGYSISLVASTYLSAVTGWYFFSFDYFKNYKKNENHYE